MAKTKLKSVFTREDVYTVLQLLKALADGVDDNEALTDADIEKLKASVDKLNGAVTIAEDHTTTIANGIVIKPTGDVDIGKNLDVDGLIRLNTPDDLTFVTGSLPTAKTYYQHTVHINFGSGGSSSNTSLNDICFTAISTNSTKIIDYSTLHTVFGGRNIAVSGIGKCWSYPGGAIMTPLFLNLHGGTMRTDYVTGTDGATVLNDSLESIQSNEGEISVTDEVTPL